MASIISSTDLHIQVKSAKESLNGFHVALVWFTPTEETKSTWTKRAILMESKKAFGLLKEPTEEDLLIIDELKKIANDIPSMSVDGTKTVTSNQDRA